MRKPEVGQSLEPPSTHGGRGIENLWKPTCENLRFLSHVMTFSVMLTNRKKELTESSIALVGFDSLPEILS